MHMKCCRCDSTAEAVCRFCGRAVCGAHIQTLNYIVTVYQGVSKQVPKALVVADAVFCGICKPQPEPLEAPYLG
jgi:hypothetical protein